MGPRNAPEPGAAPAIPTRAPAPAAPPPAEVAPAAPRAPAPAAAVPPPNNAGAVESAEPTAPRGSRRGGAPAEEVLDTSGGVARQGTPPDQPTAAAAGRGRP